MNIENEVPAHILNDTRRVVDQLRAKGVDVRGIRLPTSELPGLYFRYFNSPARPTMFGLPVFFGVEGYIDVMTVRGGGANLHINHAGKERDFWTPPGYKQDKR